MGLRFRRSIRVLPGIRINLSRSGLSTSVGVRGAHVTVGHGKVRETVGVPGSGVSYTTTQSTRSGAYSAPDSAKPGRFWRVVVGILAILFLLPVIIRLIASLFAKG